MILEAFTFPDIHCVDFQYGPKITSTKIVDFINEYNNLWKKIAITFNFGLMNGKTRGPQGHQLSNLWTLFDSKTKIPKQNNLKIKSYCTEVPAEDLNSEDENSDNTSFELTTVKNTLINSDKARILIGLVITPENGQEFKCVNDMGKFKFSAPIFEFKNFFSDTTGDSFGHAQQH